MQGLITFSYLSKQRKLRQFPCVTHQADYLIWPRSRDGNYSVKTGYDLLWERELLENASVSDSANKKLFWKRLWKMNVPSKIKNFLWRACSEALPTRSNLAKRKVLDDPTCQLYGSEHENTMHALWSCKNILTVWEANFGWLRKDFPTVVSLSDLVSLVGDHSKRLELFASVAWSIWYRRNKLRCNELCVPLEKILDSAASLLTKF